MKSKQLPFRMVAGVIRSWKLWSIDQVNDFRWSPRSDFQFPKHMFKAVVKQTECLEAKTFGLGCLGQDFILWSYAMRGLPKLIKAVDDGILTNTSTILYNDTWQLIQNSMYEPVPRMELKDIQKIWREHIHWVKKRITHTSVPAFRLEGLRFGDLIGVFLAR